MNEPIQALIHVQYYRSKLYGNTCRLCYVTNPKTGATVAFSDAVNERYLVREAIEGEGWPRTHETQEQISHSEWNRKRKAMPLYEGHKDLPEILRKLFAA
jgi:hypothetical protein